MKFKLEGSSGSRIIHHTVTINHQKDNKTEKGSTLGYGLYYLEDLVATYQTPTQAYRRAILSFEENGKFHEVKRITGEPKLEGLHGIVDLKEEK